MIFPQYTMLLLFQKKILLIYFLENFLRWEKGTEKVSESASFQIQILWLVAQSSGRQGRVGRRSEGK